MTMTTGQKISNLVSENPDCLPFWFTIARDHSKWWRVFEFDGKEVKQFTFPDNSVLNIVTEKCTVIIGG